MSRLHVLVGTFIAAAMVLAPAAHADDQSYLAALQGVPFPPDMLMTSGYYLCTQLRGGTPRSVLEGQRNYMTMLGYGARVIDAAQHELCPDTL